MPFAIKNSSKSNGYIFSISIYHIGIDVVLFKVMPSSEPLQM